MTIVCLSDTHGLHRKVDVPPGDLLIHAGDFTQLSRSKQEIQDFNRWLGELPHRYKIVIPGNHEFAFEEDPGLSRELSNAVFLVDEAVEIEGLRIWGSPLTNLYGGAFGRSNPADRARAYGRIPQRTDILITHGPPFDVLDRAPVANSPPGGCRELCSALAAIQPRLHVFGHIHGAYGWRRTDVTLFVNAALCDSSGAIAHPPVVVTLSPGCGKWSVSSGGVRA